MTTKEILEEYILHEILGEDYKKYPDYHKSVIALWLPRLYYAYDLALVEMKEKVIELQAEIEGLYQDLAGASL